MFASFITVLFLEMGKCNLLIILSLVIELSLKKIIFVSGVHGAGKSTLCSIVTQRTSLPHYSSSTLIKENSEYKELLKRATKTSEKQEILLNALDELPKSSFLLDGHFCLIGEDEQIIELADDVYYRMQPSAIINVVCRPDIVKERLSNRDSNSFSTELLSELQAYEARKADKISIGLGIPLITVNSNDCLDSVLEFIKQV